MSLRGQKIVVTFPTPSPVNDIQPMPRHGIPIPGGITPAPTRGLPTRSQSPAPKTSSGIFKRMFTGLF